MREKLCQQFDTIPGNVYLIDVTTAIAISFEQMHSMCQYMPEWSASLYTEHSIEPTAKATTKMRSKYKSQANKTTKRSILSIRIASDKSRLNGHICWTFRSTFIVFPVLRFICFEYLVCVLSFSLPVSRYLCAFEWMCCLGRYRILFPWYSPITIIIIAFDLYTNTSVWFKPTRIIKRGEKNVNPPNKTH